MKVVEKNNKLLKSVGGGRQRECSIWHLEWMRYDQALRKVQSSQFEIMALNYQ